MSGEALRSDEARVAVLSEWLGRHLPPGSPRRRRRITPHRLEVLSEEPTVVSVDAEIGGRPAHAVIGLQADDEEVRALRGEDEPVLLPLGEHTVALDALFEERCATATIEALLGRPVGERPVVLPDGEAIEVNFGDRLVLRAFPWPPRHGHPGLAFLEALDEAGFNHLPAPLAFWRRGGRDLGVVQEVLVGSVDGWALALTSLRDLYASGVAPEEAGGDFGPEAEALGVLTARMHLALAEAFGVGQGQVTVAGRRRSVPVIRPHGDFHLGRTARCDQGWVVADCLPGGCRPGSDEVLQRSPLADVADVEWSLATVAAKAAAEREPEGQPAAAALGQAWSARNRASFWRAYLGVEGMEALLPQASAMEEVTAAYRRERQEGEKKR